MKKRTTPSTKEQFIKRQEKRRRNRREIRKEIFSAIVFVAISYATVWLAAGIAYVN